MLSNRALLLLLAALAVSPSVFASEEENADRVVDQASVDMQDEADRDLSSLVAKYRGTGREAEMLLRLAELRLEIAENLFRVSFGPGEKGLKTAYEAKLAAAIVPLTRILSAYPKSEGAPRALFLRGKARKELGQKETALKDFETFLSAYSAREEAPLAAVGVADLSMQKRNYRRAITVLPVVLAKPNHPLYPNALAKRAWALQAEGRAPEAIAQLKTLAKFFQDRAQANHLSSGDNALRESVLSDVPSVAYLAFRADSKSFTLTNLNDLLLSFDRGEGYRRMAIKITAALRASDLNADLRTWKALVLKSDPSKKDSFPMLVSILEYDLDRESFDDVVRTTKDLADILTKEPETADAEGARRLVVKAIDKLTKRLSDYRKTVKANEAEKYLSVLVPAFDQMTTENDPRRMALRWNIAETYFMLERFESATASYRWLYENWNAKSAATLAKAGTRESAGLKAISSRYESLRAANVIPKDLQARADAPKTIRNPENLAALREWTTWIDAFARDTGNHSAQGLDHFEFEACRALYQAGFQDEAMTRMKGLALTTPNSKFAVPAASLVVDTLIARKRWDQVEEESTDFAHAFAASQPKFAQRMATQAASAKFKRAEIALASKDYGNAVSNGKEFVKRYGKSTLAVDAAGLVCNAYLSGKDLDAAVDCFSDFANTYSGTPAAKQALRSAARIEDERLHFGAAADLYARYLAVAKKTLSSAENLTIRKRILLLSRATGEAERMVRVSGNSALCAPKLEKTCELNFALVALQQGSDSAAMTESALKRAANGKKELRSIWAMIAIESLAKNPGLAANASVIDRASRVLSANWKNTDPSVRYFLIARATKVFPKILERDLDGLKRLSIDASERSITRRFGALKAFEARSAAISEVPVNAVRAASMNSLFTAYSDLITDIRSIPAPAKSSPRQISEHRGLVASLANPFVMKSRKLRDAAISLELRERSGLNADSVDAIWSQSFAANSSSEALRNEWSKAIRASNWSRVAFLSDEAFELKSVPAGWSKAARAVSLAEAGAASEAKVVFGDACRDSYGAASVQEACRNVAKKGRG